MTYFRFLMTYFFLLAILTPKGAKGLSYAKNGIGKRNGKNMEHYRTTHYWTMS